MWLLYLAGPRCTTVYEDECSTVDDEECTTVNDEICEVSNSEKCETVQDRRCSVTYSKQCSPNKEKKCDSVTDTINEQSCTSSSERKCSTIRHPVCHVMKVQRECICAPVVFTTQILVDISIQFVVLDKNSLYILLGSSLEISCFFFFQFVVVQNIYLFSVFPLIIFVSIGRIV